MAKRSVALDVLDKIADQFEQPLSDELVRGNSANNAQAKLPIEQIHPGAFQPRTEIDQDKIAALADSIRENDLIQPVVVRRSAKGYELLAGERRWRAAQLAGMAEIPAIVRDASDKDAALIGLVENLQREDLNPIEEAKGLQRMAAGV